VRPSNRSSSRRAKSFRQPPFFGVCNRPTQQQQQQHRYLFAYQKKIHCSILFCFNSFLVRAFSSSRDSKFTRTLRVEYVFLFVCLFVCLFFFLSFCSCCFETRFLVRSIFFCFEVFCVSVFGTEFFLV
jgi:hypothetical protein